MHHQQNIKTELIVKIYLNLIVAILSYSNFRFLHKFQRVNLNIKIYLIGTL